MLHNELKRGKSPLLQDNALFSSKAKINVFEKFFSSEGTSEVKKKFQKTLILIFEANRHYPAKIVFSPMLTVYFDDLIFS